MMTTTTALITGVLGQVSPGRGDFVATSSAVVESVWDFLIKGGPVMIPIGICSLVAFSVTVERIISLRPKHIVPPSFLQGLMAVIDDDDRQAALQYCRRSQSPTSRLIEEGVKRLGEPVDMLERHVQEAGQRQAFHLGKHLRILSVIALITPLLGLLGTIFGMINAFQTVAASAGALGKTELLAKGIYQAMITTAAGLSVAIPVLISYHWISAIIERRVSEMDQAAVTFIGRYAEHEWPLIPTPDLHATKIEDDGAEKIEEAASAAIPA